MGDVPSFTPVPEGVDEGEWAIACAVVRSYCGWHIAPVHTEDLELDGSGGAVMVLPTLRVVDVTDVRNNGTEVFPDWSRAGVMKLRGGRWSDRYRGVTATLRHGYDAAPLEVVAVAKALATSGEFEGVVSDTTGPYSQTFSEAVQAGVTGLSKYHRVILDRFVL